MAYYPSASSVPAILSETVIASIGSVGLQWKSNPIGTELEVVVMDSGHELGRMARFHQYFTSQTIRIHLTNISKIIWNSVMDKMDKVAFNN